MEEQKENLSSQEMLKTERYLWIARAFSAVAILATVANVILFSAIGSLYPLVRVQPFYLNVFDKNQQVIEIKPMNLSEVQSPLAMEALVRQYVLSRFEIKEDVKEIEERFGPNGVVALMSSTPVYEKFKEFYQKEWQRGVNKEGLTVEAFINTADQIKDRYTWRVNLTLLIMSSHSKERQEVHLLIEMRVRFNPLFKGRSTTWQDRLKNPLGFQVVHFGWKEVKKEEVTEDVKK